MIKARFRRRDGRYVYDVRLRDHSGKEYSKTFRTKKEAEAFEIAERAARLRGVWVDPRLAATRVVDVADRWLRANGAKRPGSIAARPEHPRQPHHSGPRTKGDWFGQQSRRATTS